jgi:hypothetical protein
MFSDGRMVMSTRVATVLRTLLVGFVAWAACEGSASQAMAQQVQYAVTIIWPSSNNSVRNGVINTVTGTVAVPRGGTAPSQLTVTIKDNTTHSVGARGGLTRQPNGIYTFSVGVMVQGLTPCAVGKGSCSVIVTGYYDSKGAATTHPGVTK